MSAEAIVSIVVNVLALGVAFGMLKADTSSMRRTLAEHIKADRDSFNMILAHLLKLKDN